MSDDNQETQTRWVCLDGSAASKRCPNGNLITSEHMLSDDGKRCLACGARRVPKVRDTVKSQPE
jgi:DNA-directed RNA polymerase subunit RPC12/RpoP